MPKFDLSQYSPKEVYSSLGELDAEIVLLEDNEPKDGRSKEHKIWIQNINKLFQLYNEKAKFKAYKLK